MRRWHERFTPVGCDSTYLRSQWAQFLGRAAWTYLITLTFDPKRHPRSGPEQWVKAWRWFLFAWMSSCAIQAGLAKREGDRIRGPWVNSYRKGRGVPMWVLATEPHRDDRLHAHALLMMTRNQPWLRYSEAHRVWQGSYGWLGLEKPKSQLQVSAYVSKYVVKCGPDALTISPNFDAARMPVYT